ncbi:MAG TPA: hypothetical protein VKV28_05005 [Candidatus Binataceae bacterium]|nr:hypothetical protein [Candidatus Binataceae bacterium]
MLFTAFFAAAILQPWQARADSIWGPATSGPNFTGTAEVEPLGSWYYEPWAYGYHDLRYGTWELAMPQRFAIGLGHQLEFDFYPNFILNTAQPPTTPPGKSATDIGLGNIHFEFKYGLTTDADTYHLLARPALSIKTITWIPTGNYQNLNPAAYNTDQFGNGTWNQGIGLLFRKRFKPFELYGEIDEIVEFPTEVHGGYQFNNGIDQLPFGQSLHMTDGNLLYWGFAFEHVINAEYGLGYVLEFTGQWQNRNNLFFGHANAPPWSYWWASPTVEATWPSTQRYQVTWGLGALLPVYEWKFPQSIGPIFTVTFYFNGKYGRRGE